MRLLNCILVLVATFSSIYIAELVSRAVFVRPERLAGYYPFGRDISGAHITLKQREFTVDLRYNHSGFREQEFRPEKVPGQKRILLVGDSFAEGHGVEVSQRFSSRLQEKLNTSGIKQGFEVINAGQIATQPEQYLQNIARFGISLKPDLVVISFFSGNDFMGGRNISLPIKVSVNQEFPIEPDSWEKSVAGVLKLEYLTGLISQKIAEPKDTTILPQFVRRIRSDKIWEVYFGKSISRESLASIYQISLDSFDKCTQAAERSIVADTIEGRLNPAFLGESVKSACPDPKTDVQAPFYTEEDFTHTAAVVDELVKVLSAQKIPYFFIVIPDIFDVAPEMYTKVLRQFGLSQPPPRLYQSQVLRERLLKHMMSAGYAYLDLTASLEAQVPVGYYPLDTHLNPQGHELVANRIMDHLQSRRLSKFNEQSIE